MNYKEALKIYKDNREKYNAYMLLMRTANYDSSTIAPKAGNAYRNKALAYMYGEMYSIETDPQYIEAVKYLSTQKLDETLKRKIQLELRNLDSVIKLSKEETIAFNKLKMDSFDVWEEAKQKNKYYLFKPYLLKLIEESKKVAKLRNDKINPYDLLLDDYEEGTNQKTYDEFFALIKKELIPLIKEINKKQNMVNDSFLYKYYPKDKQEKFMKEYLLKYLGFDSSWGYMGESEHPFTDSFSHNDSRITTSYDEHNISSCLFSIIHETGHAYYDHQVDKKYEGTNIVSCISMGMHESESRFCENYLGKRKAFWKKLYPKLQETFKENLKDVTLDEFYLAINASKSSLIRTDSDELTYPIHILIRYEIEKEIFNGKADLNNLNKLWNKKYKEYLGIDVPDDTRGILQDVHWSDASFGYFPTYALGSAIGAQILRQMEKDIDIDGLLEKGKYKQIMKYLQDNIQHSGAMNDYNTILKNATGEKFNPKYYINYLKKKYKNIYKI